LIGLISSNSSRRPFSTKPVERGQLQFDQIGDFPGPRGIRAYRTRGVIAEAREDSATDSIEPLLDGGDREGRAHRRSRDTAISGLCQMGRAIRTPQPSPADAAAMRIRLSGAAGPAPPSEQRLLDLDLCALLFEGALIFAASSFVIAFPGGPAWGSPSTRFLGLLEAKTGQLADDLDDRDLVGADLGEDRGELGLLLDSATAATGRRRRRRRQRPGRRQRRQTCPRTPS